MTIAGRYLLLLVLTVLLFAARAGAYDEHTHVLITVEAFGASAGFRAYLRDVGIGERDKFNRDAAKIPELLYGYENDGTPLGWLGEGVIREDEFAPFPPSLGCPKPADPSAKLSRPKHHFFDVQRGGRGLTRFQPFEFGISARDWALGVRGRGPGDDQNQFSLPDARIYQLNSLTRQTLAERNKNAVDFFRALGQVIHLLQDMGQPQHTRNDPHLGCTFSPMEWLGGTVSVYEAYIEARASVPFQYLGRPVQPLAFGGYNAVSLNAYSDFWANAGRSGLADFSGRNFFTTGTNLGASECGGLSEPTCDVSQYQTEEDAEIEVFPRGQQGVVGTVRFFLRNITDPFTGAVTSGVRVSTESLWDEHLTRVGKAPIFTLNTYNYDDMADLLVPRAAGYSAGLLDFIFRGKLDLAFVPDPDPAKIALRAKNLSAGGSEGILRAGGILTLYSDGPEGNRDSVRTLTLGTDVLSNGELPAISLDALAEVGPIIAVYRGGLGSESDAVVARVQPAAEVEQLFFSSGDWRLRTADGIFPLGIGAAPAVVKWGDADNLIVAQTFVSGSNDQIFTPYRINRPVGSRAVPLINGVVDLSPFGTPVRLGGAGVDPIDLGTTVRFRRKITLTEELTVLTVDTSNGGDPGKVVGTPSQQVFTDFNQKYPNLLSLDRTFRLGMPLTLPNPPLYLWSVLDFYLNADGHVLVSVLVQILGTSTTVPIRKFSTTTGELIDTTQPVGFSANLQPPTTNAILFLVDVTSRRALLKSSDDFVDIQHESIQQEAVIQFYDAGTNTYLVGIPHTDGTSAVDATPIVTIHTINRIDTAPTMIGLFRTELATAGFGIPGVSQPTTTPNITNMTGVSLVASEATANSFAATSMGFQDMRRSSSVDNSFALIGSTGSLNDTQTHVWVPMFWSPSQSSVTLLPRLESPIFSGASVADTSRGTMMIFINRFAAPRFTHTHFSSASGGDLLFTVDLRRQYDLLEPNLLFNVNDLKFHRINSSLDPWPAPRPLFTGPGVNTVGQYHVNGR